MRNAFMVGSVVMAIAWSGCATDRAPQSTTDATSLHQAPGGQAEASSVPARGRTANGNAKKENRLIGDEKLARLKEGMTGDEVVALLGKPDRMRELRPSNPFARVWVYRVSVTEWYEQVPVGTEEVPAFDPMAAMSGRMGTATEPVYRDQDVRVYQTAELLMANDRLAKWKTGKEVEKQLQPN